MSLFGFKLTFSGLVNLYLFLFHISLSSWIRQADGEVVGLVAVETCRRVAKIMLSCRLGTKYPVAHLNHIQIHLHNALLAPNKLNQHREICFHRLAQISARVERENVLSRLLRDRTATTYDITIVLILLIRIHNGIPIKTPMLIELGVLVVNDSSDKVRRYVLQRNPLVLYIQTAPLPIRLHMTETHERRIRHRHELKEHHQQQRREKETQQQRTEDISESLYHFRQ